MVEKLKSNDDLKKVINGEIENIYIRIEKY